MSKVYSYDPEYCHKTLYDFVLQSPYRYDGIAMEYNGKKITTQKLHKMIEVASIAYKNLGIAEDERVCMFALNTPEMIVSFYALNNIGAVSEWFNPKVMNVTLLHNFLMKNDIRFMVINNVVYDMVKQAIKGTKVETVIVNTLTDSASSLYKFGFKSALKSIKVLASLPGFKNNKKIVEAKEKMFVDRLLSYGNDKQKGLLDSAFIDFYDFIEKYNNGKKITYTKYQKDRVTLIVHSSGTTGAFKRIAMCDYQINCSGYNFSLIPNSYSPGDTMLFLIPMFVATSFFQLHTERYYHFKSFVKPLYQEDKFVSVFLKHKPTYTLVVPAFLKKLADDPKIEKADLGFVKELYFGGSGIDPDLYRYIQNRLEKHGFKDFAKISYGQSEFMGAITLNVGGNCAIKGRHYESAGEIFNNGSSLKILDNDLNDITGKKDEVTGEFIEGDIYFTSPTMFKGYYDENNKLVRPFVKLSDGKEYSKTGDEGYYDPDKGLIISGRTSVVRQKGGCKVNLTELKIMLEKHSDIEEAVVVSMPDEKLDYRAAAYILLKQNDEQTRTKVVGEIEDILFNNYTENYYIKCYVFCDSFVQTAFGKTDIGFIAKEAEKLYQDVGENIEKVIVK